MGGILLRAPRALCNNRRFSRQMSNLFLTLNNVNMSPVTDGTALQISRSSEKSMSVGNSDADIVSFTQTHKNKATENLALFLKPGDLLDCSQEICYWVSHSVGKRFHPYFLNLTDIQLLRHWGGGAVLNLKFREVLCVRYGSEVITF